MPDRIFGPPRAGAGAAVLELVDVDEVLHVDDVQVAVHVVDAAVAIVPRGGGTPESPFPTF